MKKSYLIGLIVGVSFVAILAIIYWLSVRGPRNISSVVEEAAVPLPATDNKGSEVSSPGQPIKSDKKDTKNLAEVQNIINRTSAGKSNNVSGSNPTEVQRVLKTINEINRINELNKLNKKK